MGTLLAPHNPAIFNELARSGRVLNGQVELSSAFGPRSVQALDALGLDEYSQARSSPRVTDATPGRREGASYDGHSREGWRGQS